MNVSIRLISGLATLIGVAGCGEPATEATSAVGPDPVVRTIGQMGGTMELAGARIVIPPGALESDVQITMSVLDAMPSGYATYSPVFEFGPDGTQFQRPVRVSLPFEGSGEFAAVFWSRDDGPGYERVETSIANGIAEAEITHFSDGFVADERVCSVEDNGDGTKTLSCSDGTSATISDGAPGAPGTSCSVSEGEDGTKTISCEDGTAVTVADGTSCTVAANGDGTKTITCEDGTSVTISDGANGTSCSVTDNGDGTKTIACEDGTSVLVSDGGAGEDGSSCSVVDNGDGTKTITCEDGTSVTVSDGEAGDPGASCSVTDNGDGTNTISCEDGTSVTVSDGEAGDPGASCSVTDNGDGTKTISCEGGTSVLVSDGGAGADGSSCSVVDNGDGTKTITCEDGSSVTVSDGETGDPGSSCSATDNGDGTKTIVCEDGSSVTVSDGQAGPSGTSCTVTENPDGSVTIACTDGTTATVGEAGEAESCTITANPDGSSTVSCPDGTSLTIPAPGEQNTVLYGSFEIFNSLDLQALGGTTEITGDLTIDATGLTTVSLPDLQTIGGSLRIVGTTIETLDLPALTSVGVDIVADGPVLQALTLPALETAGAIRVGSDSSPLEGGEEPLGALQRVELPDLHTCGTVSLKGAPLAQGLALPALSSVGKLTVEGVGLATLSLPLITELESLAVEANPKLHTLSLPALTTVSSTARISGTALTSVDLGELSTAGDLTVGGLGLADLVFPKLKAVTGRLVVTFTNFNGYVTSPLPESVSLPILESVGELTVEGTYFAELSIGTLSLPALTSAGDLRIQGNALLTEVDLRSLSTISGGNPAEIAFSPLLTVLRLDELVEVTQDFELRDLGLEVLALPKLHTVGGVLSVTDLAAVVGLDLGSLQSVGQALSTNFNGNAIWISYNPLLPQCLIEDALAQVTVNGGVELEGRTDCTCGGDPIVATCEP